ncbi:unnamed protein product [Mycena citricolor]|uniref:Altered inheritance of mitochondria protein 6 n=1 Tax=Mycena citricolor TaxID=2018698 RepID=A0AAD2HTK8_9AGAR|nr:unnamed protein product [Mycena citricolor]
MKSREYCCCAIPLVNAGIYLALFTQIVTGALVGVLSFATPTIVGAATPSFASTVLGIICLVAAGIQLLGVIGETYALQKICHIARVVATGAFSVALAWIILSATRHSTAQSNCETSFFSNVSTEAKSEGQILCNIFPCIYLYSVASGYSSNQERDHDNFNSLGSTTNIAMNDRSYPVDVPQQSHGGYTHLRKESAASMSDVLAEPVQHASDSYSLGREGSYPPRNPPSAYLEDKDESPTPRMGQTYYDNDHAGLEQPAYAQAHPGLVIPSSQHPGVLDEISSLQAANSSLLRYPTAFTQGIVPKQIHSHNDYWREVPLLTALSLGVASVEADVWLVNGTLHVGHEQAALTSNRTFDSLYIEPLVAIIEAQNPKNAFTDSIAERIHSGVFDTSSGTSIQLLIDMKTDGPSTLPAVLKALGPLRDRGYLTTCHSNGNCTSSAVTAIGTGNTPLAGILALTSRDVFFDAPLTGKCSQRDIYPAVSPTASTDYQTAVGWSGLGNISASQLSAIQTHIGNAHGLGIKARFWDTPGWPIRARNNVWDVLIDNGADWLNADDLQAASNHF